MERRWLLENRLTNKDSFDWRNAAKVRQSYQGLNEPGGFIERLPLCVFLFQPVCDPDCPRPFFLPDHARWEPRSASGEPFVRLERDAASENRLVFPAQTTRPCNPEAQFTSGAFTVGISGGGAHGGALSKVPSQHS